MPYAATTYDIEPGHEDEIEEIFANFKRVDTPVMRSEDGAEIGRLLGTAVFIKDDIMVRVIHYEGDFTAISRHMSAQDGVHVVEQKLAPFLRTRSAAESPEDFKNNFRNALMRCISQLSVEDHPVIV
jgi:hypothetical protein